MSEGRLKVALDVDSNGYHSHPPRKPKVCHASLRRRSRLSNAEKRLMAIGRLSEPDAEGLSDRAIARELGVSQPFVSALRRHGVGTHQNGASEALPQTGDAEPRREQEPMFGDTALGDRERAFLDTTPRARWVTRPTRPGAASALSDFDPFN